MSLQPNTPAHRMVTASDGCMLALHTLRPGPSTSSGQAGAEPLVFLHALAMDARMWQGVADSLDTAVPLYALDCRGHGASGKPAGPYTTARFAEDLAQVLDSLGAARAHVVGCSMGGTVALAFAGLYPQRVASLSVVDCTAWYGDDAPDAWEGRAQRALREGLASLIPFQAERWFSPGFAESSPEVLAGAVEVFLRNDVNAYAESCRMLGRTDERERLSRYTGPAVVIVGEADYATPLAMSQDIRGRLTGAELAVLDGLRHYTPMEAPDRVARRITSVLVRASSLSQQ